MGYPLAERIAAVPRKIAPSRCTSSVLKIDKHSQGCRRVIAPPPRCRDKVVCAGGRRTELSGDLIYALDRFSTRADGLRTVVLIDRNHRRYDRRRDFVETTFAEHVQ